MTTQPDTRQDGAGKPGRRTLMEDYIEVQPALHMVRVMRRFFDEVVAEPRFHEHQQELYVSYMEILNEELSSYALTLAQAVVKLEEANPKLKLADGRTSDDA